MDELKADSVLQERLKSLPNVEVFVSSQTTEVIGNGDKLTALRIKDRKTEEERLVELDGMYIRYINHLINKSNAHGAIEYFIKDLDCTTI